MIDWVDLAKSLAESPALYAVLAAVSLLDSFLPLIPSEPVVILAGIAAAAGQTSIVLVITATTVGAFLGDCVPYVIGRLMGERVLKRLPAGTRRRTAYDWFTRELESRGGFVLISTRFIPIGRYLATGAAGVVGYPGPQVPAVRRALHRDLERLHRPVGLPRWSVLPGQHAARHRGRGRARVRGHRGGGALTPRPGPEGRGQRGGRGRGVKGIPTQGSPQTRGRSDPARERGRGRSVLAAGGR